MAAEVRECYRLFVSGLLAITDNVVAGAVQTPAGVYAADGEDTYLVVAADRGTATFSDLANDISVRHGFWLGDAFASGGSRGYDHKAMGITARGAWVVARQHFRQLAIDPEAEEVRVIGVGDMSGDVFGNGMLRSRTIRLIAAFDHRHIFVDPDPDPARSFAERARLFATPGSSWQDYDRAVLSPGGGVWSRATKQVALSSEARQVLGVSAEVLTPPELVSAILTASADMLWLGGIGTFVKAAGETHADVGDRANDAVRVDADQVRARVVVEGGNLGFTQRARIVYSRRGGKINADFIDNAAGVATSDYEVNLKILLALAIERGVIAASERDPVLHAVQDDVAQAVLHDVGLTALAVTRAVPEQRRRPRRLRSTDDPPRGRRAFGPHGGAAAVGRGDGGAPGRRGRPDPPGGGGPPRPGQVRPGPGPRAIAARVRSGHLRRRGRLFPGAGGGALRGAHRFSPVVPAAGGDEGGQ